MEETQLKTALEELLQSGQLLVLEGREGEIGEDDLVVAADQWQSITAQAVSQVSEFHQSYSLKRGMPREALKSRLKMDQRIFTAAMRKWTQEGLLVEAGTLLQLPHHKISFKPGQQKLIDQLLAQFAAAPFAPPSVKDSQALVGEDVYFALIELDILKQVSDDVVFRSQDFEQIVSRVVAVLQNEGSITVAQFRDMFNTSRKYALAALEYMDEIGVTRRDGDLRRLNVK
jgi:selenocysteine-specific elongation factor